MFYKAELGLKLFPFTELGTRKWTVLPGEEEHVVPSHLLTFLLPAPLLPLQLCSDINALERTPTTYLK